MADKHLQRLLRARQNANQRIVYNTQLRQPDVVARLRRRITELDREIAQHLSKEANAEEKSRSASVPSAPQRKAVPKNRATASKANEPSKIIWPIPLTPATPPPSTSASLPRQPRISDAENDSEKSAPARPLEPKRPAEPPLCPVCERPVLAAGRKRHQRCERVRALSSLDQAKRDITSSPPPPVGGDSETAAYRSLVRKVERREAATYGRRHERVSRDPIRLQTARRAVLMRSRGHCENPACGGQPADVTDDGQAILEVDHVERIAEGGRDHPAQMVALCPNCHAMKERGAARAALRSVLLDVAMRNHDVWHNGSIS
ncbi:hypothetical protein GCM10009716_05870 [Streptomyces sodiiphilus]|uniref:HNH nuclease domain-containing protein n=1 Tax=Streptomyces sodiiphilus TaxID=226217 RepID=A0ABP5A1G4_9ACTN